MIERENKLLALATKRGIELSKIHDLPSVCKLMEEAKLPDHVIDRVLYEPMKIRSTDL